MNKFAVLLIGVVVTACSQSKPEPDTAARPAPPAMAEMKRLTPEQDAPGPEDKPVPEPLAPPVAPTNRKIIRNATVRIRVSSFVESGRAIEQAVQQAGGQIAQSDETKSGSSIENSLTIRVPAARFEDLLNKLVAQSIFTDTKTITAEDVTRQYVDVEARIRSKKAVEETYLKLLKQARTVADVLKIEEQLGQIREEREVQEAELRQLKDQVALSTINLTYYQQTEAALNPEEPFYTQIGRNLTDGIRLVGSVLVNIFYFLPLGLLVAAIIWGISRWRRKLRNRA